MRKLNTVADQAMSMTASVLKKEMFVKTDGNDIMLLLSWIYCHISTVLDVGSLGLQNTCMHTLCIPYERQTCSICMQSKAALSLQRNTDTFQILTKTKYLFNS